MTEDKIISIVLDSPDKLIALANRLKLLDYSTPWAIIARPYRPNRSLEQSNCWHGWTSFMADALKLERASFKEDMKARIVVPILRRDDKEYAEAFDRLTRLYNEGKEEDTKWLAAFLKRRTSTTQLNVKQMAEALDQLEKFAADLMITLPKKPE